MKSIPQLGVHGYVSMSPTLDHNYSQPYFVFIHMVLVKTLRHRKNPSCYSSVLTCFRQKSGKSPRSASFPAHLIGNHILLIASAQSCTSLHFLCHTLYQMLWHLCLAECYRLWWWCRQGKQNVHNTHVPRKVLHAFHIPIPSILTMTLLGKCAVFSVFWMRKLKHGGVK